MVVSPKPRIVLVRPRNPGNIGACARAMSNFGFTDLVVVDPYIPIWEETRAAPDAEDLVKKAKKVKTLTEAVKGFRHVWGTSSFAHTRQEQAIVKLPTLAAAIARVPSRDKIALVFGSERSGLSNDELARCHTVLQIPMAKPGVSMNLAQAVAVVLYEWTRHKPSNHPAIQPSAVDPALIEEWIGLARLAAYPPGYKDAARAGRIRRAAQDATLSPEASRFFLSFSRWIAKTIRKRST